MAVEDETYLGEETPDGFSEAAQELRDAEGDMGVAMARMAVRRAQETIEETAEPEPFRLWRIGHGPDSLLVAVWPRGGVAIGTELKPVKPRVAELMVELLEHPEGRTAGEVVASPNFYPAATKETTKRAAYDTAYAGVRALFDKLVPSDHPLKPVLGRNRFSNLIPAGAAELKPEDEPSYFETFAQMAGQLPAPESPRPSVRLPAKESAEARAQREAKLAELQEAERRRRDEAIVRRIAALGRHRDVSIEDIISMTRREGSEVDGAAVVRAVESFNEREVDSAGKRPILNLSLQVGQDRVIHFRLNPKHVFAQESSRSVTHEPRPVLMPVKGRLMPMGIIDGDNRIPFTPEQQRMLAALRTPYTEPTAKELALGVLPIGVPNKATWLMKEQAQQLLDVLFAHGFAVRIKGSSGDSRYRLRNASDPL